MQKKKLFTIAFMVLAFSAVSFSAMAGSCCKKQGSETKQWIDRYAL